MWRIFLRGVMAVTEAGGTLTKTVSQHCDGGDDVPTYSICHRKHGLRLGGLPWLHGRRVGTPRPGPKRPTRTLSRLPGPPPLPEGRDGLARSDPLHDLDQRRRHPRRPRAVPSTAPPWSPSSSRPLHPRWAPTAGNRSRHDHCKPGPPKKAPGRPLDHPSTWKMEDTIMTTINDFTETAQHAWRRSSGHGTSPASTV